MKYEAIDMQGNTARFLGTFPTYGEALTAVHTHRKNQVGYDRDHAITGFEIIQVAA